MTEEVLALAERQGIDELAYAVPKTIERALGCFSERRLELGEGELDRVEVGGVRQQEEEACAPPLDKAANLGAFVPAEIIEISLDTELA